MTNNAMDYTTFLKQLPLFQRFSQHRLRELINLMKPLRYHIGQTILTGETLPHQVIVLLDGRIRVLGVDHRQPNPVSLELLKPGAVVGWVGLVRGNPCESILASTEVTCLSLPAEEFMDLLTGEPELRHYCQQTTSLSEVANVIHHFLKKQAKEIHDFLFLTRQANDSAIVQYIHKGEPNLKSKSSEYVWLVSQDGVKDAPLGSILSINFDINNLPEGDRPDSIRLLGFPSELFNQSSPSETEEPLSETDVWMTPISQLSDHKSSDLATSHIPYAPFELPYQPKAKPHQSKAEKKIDNYPHVRGKGNLDNPIACFQMICQYFNMPFRRDILKRVITEQLSRVVHLSLPMCGAIAELMGLRAQLLDIPTESIGRIETPALIPWQGNFAVLYEKNGKELILGVPESGIIRHQISEIPDLALPNEEQPATIPVLLLQQTKYTPQQKFGLQWFMPSVQKYRWVLLEVLFASFAVQLFGLANPLMVQVIIDKVIVQNSIDTLQVLGIFLIIVAVFEAILSSLRTFLFVDTTNRIDLSLGSEIIDHLLKLPLRYFERKSVGELSTRINELENIRQFLTGTALSAVLDVIFSFFYIGIMFFYSWKLTLVALDTIPVFVILTIVVTPIIRQRLWIKAEHHANTQSYLNEVLSGIQTVKAQNIELKSRWQWQSRYTQYVSAGYQTVVTSTTAGSFSNFFNQLSTLLVLWVGAYLVLKQELTLGQLIAFRIIAGYVNSPMLRLAQLWQNFQETGISLQRLSDIVDSPQEADEQDRLNIPMPAIAGRVVYENLSFRFGESGPMQLLNINLDLPAGTFVGIVGQSGSGKSTLTKLLPRLYEPNSGRILIDDYDISKVELYSLRRQIGIVPQDALLFAGTVQENISLTCHNATAEEIITSAKVAYAHDFIMSLPSGYNTQVGERGASLSGGQRQRIAIARTVLQNPEMLILDEATSALDYDSEKQVCLNLARAYPDRTVFFITHRLNTIKHADVIIMMDKGTVVELGTHEELMEKQGFYFCLYQQQEGILS